MTVVDQGSAVVAHVTDEERVLIGRIAGDHGMGVGEFCGYAILEYCAAFVGGQPMGGDE